MFGFEIWSSLFAAFAVAAGYMVKRLVVENDYGTKKGPVLYPYVGCLLETIINKDRLLEWVTGYLVSTAGNTFKFLIPGEKPFYFTANPANVEHLVKTKFEIYIKGEYLQNAFGDLLGDGIFNADGDLWKMQRKIASCEFRTTSLRDYLMNALQAGENRLIPTIERFCTNAQVLDMQDLFTRFAFDNICKLAFGVNPATVNPAFPEVQFMKCFDQATFLSMQRCHQLHPIIWKIKKFLNVGSEKKLQQAIIEINEFANSVIHSRKSLTSCRKDTDLLTRFMGVDSSDKFLRDIIISFVLAGRDTTSVTLTWFFWLLATNEDVEQKVLTEIRKIMKARLPASKDSGFTYNELKELHYLHAAITETLRLYPAVPFVIKVATQDDVWPDGSLIVKGMRATYCSYAMGRLEKTWGEDCLEFRPERWISTATGAYNPYVSPYAFPAFHGGPRICLGKDMAMLQMKYVAAIMISKFKFRLLPGYKPEYKVNLTLQMKDGLPMTVHAR